MKVVAMVLEEDEHGGLLADRSNSLVQRSRGKLSVYLVRFQFFFFFVSLRTKDENQTLFC